MGRKNLQELTQCVQSIPPGAITSDTHGDPVDCVGGGAVTVLFFLGTWTDGSHEFGIEVSADNDSWDLAPAADLAGSCPTVAKKGDDSIGILVSYLGGKRFVRASVLVSGTPEDGLIASAVILVQAMEYSTVPEGLRSISSGDQIAFYQDHYPEEGGGDGGILGGGGAGPEGGH
jgi:hypothetical protein